MKRMLLSALLLGVIVLLSSCAPDNGGGGANWKTFIGGTQGVEPSFEIDAPPSEVNAGDPFYVTIILENRGEHTVRGGEYFVSLKGFSPEDFGTTVDALTVRPQDDLIANTLNPDTGEVLESYPVYVQIPAGENLAFQGNIAGNTPFPFVANVCYQYMTTANAKLCVKEELTKPNDPEVCQISGPQAISSSAGPVQITDFKEFSGGPNAVRFSFKVIAADTGGKLSELGSGCDQRYDKVDRVLVKIDTGFANPPRCNGFVESLNGLTNEGYVKLSGGSRQISCTQELTSGEQSDYIKIVTITAEYDYQKSLTTNVLVKPMMS